MAVEYDWSGYPAVKEARAEGELRGATKGIRASLIAILIKQFGPVPAWAQKKIEKASKETAMDWLVRAGGAETPANPIPCR